MFSHHGLSLAREVLHEIYPGFGAGRSLVEASWGGQMGPEMI